MQSGSCKFKSEREGESERKINLTMLSTAMKHRFYIVCYLLVACNLIKIQAGTPTSSGPMIIERVAGTDKRIRESITVSGLPKTENQSSPKYKVVARHTTTAKPKLADSLLRPALLPGKTTEIRDEDVWDCQLKLYSAVLSEIKEQRDVIRPNGRLFFLVPLMILYWNHRHPNEALPLSDIGKVAREFTDGDEIQSLAVNRMMRKIGEDGFCLRSRLGKQLEFVNQPPQYKLQPTNANAREQISIVESRTNELKNWLQSITLPSGRRLLNLWKPKKFKKVTTTTTTPAPLPTQPGSDHAEFIGSVTTEAPITKSLLHNVSPNLPSSEAASRMTLRDGAQIGETGNKNQVLQYDEFFNMVSAVLNEIDHIYDGSKETEISNEEM